MTQETMELIKKEEKIETPVVIQKPTTLPATQDITDKIVDSWNQMQRMAKAFEASGLMPDSLKGKFNDILVILQLSKEINIPPMQGIYGINVIQGKPSISPRLMLSLIYSRVPGCVIEFRENTAQKAEVYMSRSKDQKGFTSVWDTARATSMGLIGKDNYKKQPATMLKWRAVGEAAGTIFPDVVQGFYVTEELVDLEPSKPQPSTINTTVDVNEILEQSNAAS